MGKKEPTLDELLARRREVKEELAELNGEILRRERKAKLDELRGAEWPAYRAREWLWRHWSTLKDLVVGHAVIEGEGSTPPPVLEYPVLESVVRSLGGWGKARDAMLGLESEDERREKGRHAEATP